MTAPSTVSLATSADLDRDGRAEVLAIVAKVLMSFTLKEDGAFEGVPLIDLPWTSGRVSELSLFAGDFDGDGDQDVVAASENYPYHLPFSPILLGNGTGALSTGPDQWFAGTPSAAVADFDRDGRQDVAIVEFMTFAASHAYRGFVAFGASSGFDRLGNDVFPSFAVAPATVQAADFDGDGWIDLAVAHSQSGVQIWKGGPGRSFSRGTNGSIAAGLVVTDFDGDGRPDLLGTNGTKVEVQINACGSTIPDAVLPAVVSTSGVNGTRFETEVTVQGAGTLAVSYVASTGDVTGTGSITLTGTTQRRFRSAFDLLEEAGIHVPEGSDHIGTLSLRSTTGQTASLRVVSRVRSTVSGRSSGVGVEGVPAGTGLSTHAIVGWLREEAADRSNLAVVNTGGDVEGDITLQVTLYPDVPGAHVPVLLEGVTLAPGKSLQWNRVLSLAGFNRGWARVERTAGSGPFFAYGVVNDEGTGDGAYLPAQAADRAPARSYVIPSIVESGRYASDLVVTNAGAVPVTVDFRFVCETLSTEDRTARFRLEVPAEGQTTIGDVVDWMRRNGVAGVGPRGGEFVGALFADLATGPSGSVFLGARTSAPKPEGRYGVFLPALPTPAPRFSVTIPAVRQDDEVRTNIAIVNTDSRAITLTARVQDPAQINADHGSRTFDLEPGRFVQLGSILSLFGSGLPLARVIVSGQNNASRSFVAYGVTNDGAIPGAGTDDGTVILAR
ncbi:MAG: VCBS repeat-containing protein [Acidobacteria bacterium]|nr:VCBS repeat-containing protein [Acidobacteriota bacterium]